MSTPLTMEATIQFHRGRKGRKILRRATEFGTEPLPESGRIPRIARLLALAIRLDGLVEAGTVKNYADLASMGHVTRARISQIMNLRLLAPDIQVEILFLKRLDKGRDPIPLRDLQPIAALATWPEQRRRWRKLVNARS
jgi:hypothetical protein